MSLSAEQFRERLEELCAPGARGRLLDRGLARGMIWREGELPDGSPAFSTNLTTDLLGYGFGVLAQTLKLQELEGRSDLTDRGYLVAAESLEAVARRGAPADERGFYLLVAAVSFHLGRYGARAYCLLPSSDSALNLSPIEATLHKLMRRTLSGFRFSLQRSLLDRRYGVPKVDEEPFEDIALDAELMLGGALQHPLLRALAFFEFALQTGDSRHVDSARRLNAAGRQLAAEAGFPNIWWAARLSEHLMKEVWSHSYHVQIPEELPPPASQDEQIRWTDLRQRFIWRILAKKPAQLDLWPSQIEAAARAPDQADDLVVALPTSAGKTRIAELCILRTIAAQRRIIYVTPLRALSAQVEAGLRDVLGPLGISISSLYGASGVALVDIDELRTSDVVVATPEKLDFSLRQAPDVLNDVGLIVLDEGHMIGEGSREVRYEVLVQRLLRRTDAEGRRLVALSAVFSSGETLNDFTGWLRSDAPGEAIRSSWQPSRKRMATLLWSPERGAGRLNLQIGEESPFVPRWLEAEEPQGLRRNPFPQNARELTIAVAQRLCVDGHQTLVFAPERRSVESLAKLCLTLERQGHLNNMLADIEQIDRATSIGVEWLGADHPAVQCLTLGIAVHHGRLPRPFLRELESLVGRGVLKMVVASPTIAQGLDLSCSALVFHSLYRFKRAIDRAEFRNVIGRVGRAFVDLEGLVVLPVYEPDSNANRRLRQFHELREEATQHQLISGILHLVNRVLHLLAERTGLPLERLSEYIMNHDGPWGSENQDDKIDEYGDESELLRKLEELDTVILATIEDPTISADRLEAALDEALRGSLWRRQLHFAQEYQALFENTLLARARWLWQNTSDTDRRAYYWAGIGSRAGDSVRDNIGDLVSNLTTAELALLHGDTDEAIEALTSLAGFLLTLYPFTPPQFPERWEDLLAGWVRGASADEAEFMGDSNALSFIHEGLVYRFVWALETVRAIGLAMGIPECDEMEGVAATCITYGIPSREGAMLVRAGLHSRSLAVKLLHRFPATFADIGGLAVWVEDIRRTDEIYELLKNEHERRLWAAFLSQRGSDSGARWRETEREVDVDWDRKPPPNGATLRIDPFDPTVGRTVVRRPDFSRLGTTREDLQASGEGITLAQMSDRTDKMRVFQFGMIPTR